MKKLTMAEMNKMTMAELRAEVEQRKNKLEELETIAVEERRKVAKRVKTYLEELLDGCTVNVRGADYDDIRAEVGFDSGKRFANGDIELEFGATFSVSYCKRFIDDTKQLHINHGTVGEFTKDDKYLVARIKAMAKLLENVEQVEEFMSNINLDNCEKYRRANFDIYSIKSELDDRERKEKISIAEKHIVVGNTYKIKGDTFTIYKVTDKNVLTTDRYGYKHRTSKSNFLHYIMRAKDYGIVAGFRAIVCFLSKDDQTIGVYPTWELANKAACEFESNNDEVHYSVIQPVTESEVE